MGDHFFDVSDPIPAESRMDAQGMIALDDDVRATRIDHLALRQHTGISRFRTVEVNISMRPIAEWFLAGLPTSAESVYFTRFKRFSLFPRKWLTVLGDDLCLAYQWDITVNDEGAVPPYHNLLAVVGIASIIHCHELLPFL
jgi:hypothetical protein